jgi:hypothetical protein
VPQPGAKVVGREDGRGDGDEADVVPLFEHEPGEVDGVGVHRLVQAVDEDDGFRLGSGQLGCLSVAKVFGPEVAEAGGRLALAIELADRPSRDLRRHGVAASEDEKPSLGVALEPSEASVGGGAAGLVHAFLAFRRS